MSIDDSVHFAPTSGLLLADTFRSTQGVVLVTELSPTPITEYIEIPNRGRSLTIDSGWERVAQTCAKLLPNLE
jgi:hypothetical protein